jgi:hypothetical protein
MNSRQCIGFLKKVCFAQIVQERICHQATELRANNNFSLEDAPTDGRNMQIFDGDFGTSSVFGQLLGKQSA